MKIADHRFYQCFRQKDLVSGLVIVIVIEVNGGFVMRKIIVLFSFAAMMSLAACGTGSTKNGDSTVTEQITETTTDTEESEEATEGITEANDSGTTETPGTEEETTEQTPDNEQGNSNISMPVLDEINQLVTVGTAGSYLKAVQAAVKLMDWGVGTGLGADEIKDAASAWMAGKSATEQEEFVQKMEMVDDAYIKLLGTNEDEVKDLLESAGCSDASYPWSDGPIDSVEAVLAGVGLR